MNEKDILKIVEEAFESHIEAVGWSDDGTPEADISGFEGFLGEVEDKLRELFNANDLGKI